MLGLEGEAPGTVDTEAVPARLQRIRESGRLAARGDRLLKGAIDACSAVEKSGSSRRIT
jgi:hypothetical protein